jgi:hypothetical protein
MRFFRFLRRGVISAVSGTLLLASTAHASPGDAVPPLFAKSWGIGYALVFLAVLLGLLAVLIPSMRKTLRRRD